MSDETDNFNGVEILRSVTPNWLADGKGIRGTVEVLAASAAEMSWPRASIEGGDNNEQVPDASLSGGGSAPEEVSYRPFQLIDASDDQGAKLKVNSGTINNIAVNEQTQAVSGNGVVYASVAIDNNGGVTGRGIGIAASAPPNTNNQSHTVIGTYSVNAGKLTVSGNTGNLTYRACRDWFINPPKYNHSWSRI